MSVPSGGTSPETVDREGTRKKQGPLPEAGDHPAVPMVPTSASPVSADLYNAFLRNTPDRATGARRNFTCLTSGMATDNKSVSNGDDDPGVYEKLCGAMCKSTTTASDSKLQKLFLAAIGRYRELFIGKPVHLPDHDILFLFEAFHGNVADNDRS